MKNSKIILIIFSLCVLLLTLSFFIYHERKQKQREEYQKIALEVQQQMEYIKRSTISGFVLTRVSGNVPPY